jgi:SAM-dependent methyltransferase
MIALAERHGPSEIRYLVGDSSSLDGLGSFDAVTSIMVLQFINDLDACAAAFHDCLAPGGLFVFAVHNPDYVTLCLAHGFKFKGFGSADEPARGFIDFDRGRLIPLFNRNSEEYEQVFLSKGFEKVLEEYPPFTEDFVARYAGSQQRELLAEPKYLILGFRKTS